MVRIFTRRLKVNDDNDCTFNLNDDVTIDTSNITMNSSMSSYAVDTVTIGSALDMAYTITDTTGYSWADSDGNNIIINTHEPVDFTDCLPDFSKIQAMCAEYPGLDKAFDNFKMTYKMVHQDWVGKQKKK